MTRSTTTFKFVPSTYLCCTWFVRICTRYVPFNTSLNTAFQDFMELPSPRLAPSICISKSSYYYLTIIRYYTHRIIGIISKRSVPYTHYLTIILLLSYHYPTIIHYYSTYYSTYYTLLNFFTLLCTIKLPIMHYYTKYIY